MGSIEQVDALVDDAAALGDQMEMINESLGQNVDDATDMAALEAEYARLTHKRATAPCSTRHSSGRQAGTMPSVVPGLAPEVPANRARGTSGGHQKISLHAL